VGQQEYCWPRFSSRLVYITSLARCCAGQQAWCHRITKTSLLALESHGARFDTDRFVVRAGYGIFYDLQNQWYGLTTYDNISTYIGGIRVLSDINRSN